MKDLIGFKITWSEDPQYILTGNIFLQKMSAGGWKSVETGYPTEETPAGVTRMPETNMGKIAGAQQAFLRQATVSDEERVS